MFVPMGKLRHRGVKWLARTIRAAGFPFLAVPHPGLPRLNPGPLRFLTHVDPQPVASLLPSEKGILWSRSLLWGQGSPRGLRWRQS